VIVAMRKPLAILFVAALALSGACRGGEEPTDMTATVDTVVVDPDPVDTAPPPGPVDVDTSVGTTILVVMEDNSIGLPTIDVPAGPAIFSVTNAGTQVHDLAVEDGQVAVELEGTLDPGQTKTLSIDLRAGTTYEVYCPILDHRQKGQSAQLKIPR
jgi:uncharacterized cupredoxin-like copper-binding protein